MPKPVYKNKPEPKPIPVAKFVNDKISTKSKALGTGAIRITLADAEEKLAGRPGLCWQTQKGDSAAHFFNGTSGYAICYTTLIPMGLRRPMERGDKRCGACLTKLRKAKE